MPPLVHLDRVTAGHPAGPPVFRDLSWSLGERQTWAVVAPTGGGKSTFARLVAGQLPARAGAVSWPGLDPRTVRRVTFRADTRTMNGRDHYYQERFQFSDPVTTPTVEAYLRDGADVPAGAVAHWAERFDLLPLLGERIVTLSTGQLRRAQLARALVAEPGLLVLDDPFAGLDVSARVSIADLLGDVAADVPVLLLTRPGPVPAWVTNMLTLPGPAAEADEDEVTPSTAFGEPWSEPPLASGAGSVRGHPVEFRDVSVRYGGCVTLDRVTWTVRRGERWLITGPNGAGKSTLLSLISGDHPQAFAQAVTLFGRRRGDVSVWDWKRPVGLVSGELHQYFREPLTLRQAAATGFTDTLVPRRLTAAEAAPLDRLLAEFRASDIADRPFLSLSAGQQRLGLIVRALVKRPPLVILDEPFQPFDGATAAHCRRWLERNLTPEQTLLFVTHEDRDRPRTLTHELRLDAGRAT